MTRAILLLVPLFVACESANDDGPYPSGTDGSSVDGEAPGDALVDEDVEGPSELAIVAYPYGCDSSFETPPDNACDGEPRLGVSATSVTDASGDGRWQAGEVLTVEVDFYTTNTEADGHVNYPRVFVDVLEGAITESTDDLDGVAFFYAIMPNDPLHVTYQITADPAVRGRTELLFTVGALNCETNEAWGACPTPSPMRITLDVE